MTWLRATSLLLATAALLACNNGDDSSSGPTGDASASQPPPTKFEAGAPCLYDNDCASGLVCLFPATNCQAFRVCVTPPPSPCDHPQTACSCLDENVQVCDGYSVDAILSLTPCADTGVVVIPDSGTDGQSAPDATTPVDAGLDASDAAPGIDAGDAGVD